MLRRLFRVVLFAASEFNRASVRMIYFSLNGALPRRSHLRELNSISGDRAASLIYRVILRRPELRRIRHDRQFFVQHFTGAKIRIAVTLKAKARCNEARPMIVATRRDAPLSVAPSEYFSELNNRIYQADAKAARMLSPLRLPIQCQRPTNLIR